MKQTNARLLSPPTCKCSELSASRTWYLPSAGEEWRQVAAVWGCWAACWRAVFWSQTSFSSLFGLCEATWLKNLFRWGTGEKGTLHVHQSKIPADGRGGVVLAVRFPLGGLTWCDRSAIRGRVWAPAVMKAVVFVLLVLPPSERGLRVGAGDHAGGRSSPGPSLGQLLSSELLSWPCLQTTCL